jgi:hypothetical protein
MNQPKQLTFWPLETEITNPWTEVISSLFGTIRAIEYYADVYKFGVPSQKIREAGERLIALSNRMNHETCE